MKAQRACASKKFFVKTVLVSSEAVSISIDEPGSIAPKVYTYASFFLLNFIFHKKSQVVVGYRFFFFLV